MYSVEWTLDDDQWTYVVCTPYSVDILTLTAGVGKDAMLFVYSVHGQWPVPPHKHPINAVSKIITELCSLVYKCNANAKLLINVSIGTAGA